MQPIFGNDVIVSMLVPGPDQYFPIFCATDMSLRITQDEVLATSASTGAYRRRKLRGLADWSVTASGVTKINNDDGQISWFYLVQESIRGNSIDIKIDFTDEDGNEQTISGSAIVPDLGITGPAADFSQADVTFRGDGPISMDPVADPNPATCEQEETLYIECVEGESSVHHDLLEQDGVVIIGVARTGTTLYETTGTPGNLEFEFVAADGDILTDPNNTYNAGEWIAVEYKIMS